MKHKSLFWVALSAATSLLISAPAFAQEEPPPPEAPPPEEAPPTTAPAAEPPPDTPPGQPAPGQPVPPPQPIPGTQPAPVGYGATTAPQYDTGAKPTTPPGGQAKPKPLAWRLSSFGWDHSASTETVGIGRDTQSRNPSYEMSFVLQPRYYVWESDTPRTQSISLRGRLDLIREFTNSDTTTNRGEWTFSDLSVFPQYSINVYKEGEDVSTDLALRLPTLGFPTSKVSANNGRILQAGVMAIGAQKVPVLGSSEPVLQNFTLTLRSGYSHWFTRATQPTNDDLDRVRMGPDGRALPGDQLSGAAFAQHNASFDVIGALQVHEKVTWTNWFQWGLAWKYRYDDTVEICNVASGCVEPDRVEDPTNYAVTTMFNTEVGVEVTKEFEVDVGYVNLTAQIGPDGQRRNIFYSPDARVYITFVAHLDEIYLSATGTRPAETANAPAKKKVAVKSPNANIAKR